MSGCSWLISSRTHFTALAREPCRKKGWKDLGSLFILRRAAVVNLVALAPDIRTGPEIPVEDEKVAEVLVTIRDGARSMSPA